jgi:hypothetical protein
LSIGYLNYTYFDDNDAWAISGIAIAAIPFAFAKKLGTSLREVILSMFMWLIIGGIIIWLYGMF